MNRLTLWLYLVLILFGVSDNSITYYDIEEYNWGAPSPNTLYERELRSILKNDMKDTVERRLNLGPILGHIAEVDGVTAEVFNSVPYAKSPVGERRYENPEPLNPWKTTINTTKTSECWQFPEFPRTTLWMDEDCLFFKIVVPLDANGQRYKEKLPAVFWIHGGSYIAGSKEYYKVKQIIQHFSSRKIIFIAPNYRLGVFGFLTTLHSDFSGNYGLEDIIMALRVVRDNSDNFGIDVDRITLAGESAGGGAVSILAVSPRTKGLFSSIHLSSGSSLGAFAVRTKSTNISSNGFIKQCKCERPTAAEMKKCMKSSFRGCLTHYYMDMISTTDSWYEVFRMGASLITPVVDNYRGNMSMIPRKIEELVRDEARLTALISGVPHERHYVDLMKEQIDSHREIPYDALRHKQIIRNKTDSLISWNLKSRKFVVQAIRQKYDLVEGDKLVNGIVQLLTDDFIAAFYAEALKYAERGQTVYLIENNVQPDPSAYIVHGTDIAVVFNNTRCSLCNDANECDSVANGNWTAVYIDILTEFIKTRKIESLQPFKTNHRNAYRLSANGTQLMDYYTDKYYFWRQTLPTLENLVLDDSISSTGNHISSTAAAPVKEKTG